MLSPGLILLSRFFNVGHRGLTINHRERGLHYRGTESKKTDPLLTEWKAEYDRLPDNPVRLDNSGQVIRT